MQEDYSKRGIELNASRLRMAQLPTPSEVGPPHPPTTSPPTTTTTPSDLEAAISVLPLTEVTCTSNIVKVRLCKAHSAGTFWRPTTQNFSVVKISHMMMEVTAWSWTPKNGGAWCRHEGIKHRARLGKTFGVSGLKVALSAVWSCNRLMFCHRTAETWFCGLLSRGRADVVAFLVSPCFSSFCNDREDRSEPPPLQVLQIPGL